MPAGFRLKNLPVSALPTHVQENVVARSLCRQYTGNLLARTVWRQARQAAQRLLRSLWAAWRGLVRSSLLHQICQDIVGDVVEKTLSCASLRQFARALPGRHIRYVPASLLEDQSLPAARLADRNRQLLDRPRLRLMSGEEIMVEIPNHCSTHDFYQLARATLNLGRSTSLALLRMGPGSVEHPLLPCVRWESSHLIKQRVFQVVTHK